MPGYKDIKNLKMLIARRLVTVYKQRPGKSLGIHEQEMAEQTRIYLYRGRQARPLKTTA